MRARAPFPQVKPSALDGLVLDLPSDPTNSSGPITTFQPKKSSAQYDIYFAPSKDSSHKRKRSDTDDSVEHAADSHLVVGGGDEMSTLVPLLPCKSRGDKLYQSPRPLTQSLIITRHLPASLSSHQPSSLRPSSLIASQPSPVPGAILSSQELLDSSAIAAKKVAREQPPGLKMRIHLGGMSAQQGGQGLYHHPPTPSPHPSAQPSSTAGVPALDEASDVEMASNDDASAVVKTEGDAAGASSPPAQKKSKKSASSSSSTKDGDKKTKDKKKSDKKDKKRAESRV
jgi:hypothetical protein